MFSAFQVVETLLISKALLAKRDPHLRHQNVIHWVFGEFLNKSFPRKKTYKNKLFLFKIEPVNRPLKRIFLRQIKTTSFILTTNQNVILWRQTGVFYDPNKFLFLRNLKLYSSQVAADDADHDDWPRAPVHDCCLGRSGTSSPGLGLPGLPQPARRDTGIERRCIQFVLERLLLY